MEVLVKLKCFLNYFESVGVGKGKISDFLENIHIFTVLAKSNSIAKKMNGKNKYQIYLFYIIKKNTIFTQTE